MLKKHINEYFNPLKPFFDFVFNAIFWCMYILVYVYSGECVVSIMLVLIIIKCKP